MERKEIIRVFDQLGKALRSLAGQSDWQGYECGLTQEEFTAFRQVIQREQQYNPWFTPENVRTSLLGIASFLDETVLDAFVSRYTYSATPKSVAVIMAGNIPFVGFHDLLCVLLSGNKVVCKLSSQDARIPVQVIQLLYHFDNRMKERVAVALGPIKGFDAVIATGSNNSIGHFETYFGKYPHLFRQNRTSIAVLDGTETPEELAALASDCFLYFGMGCRNVSKIFIPSDYNVDLIFEALLSQSDLINHHKYGNNYDYNRTVYLMNNIPFLDNNCVMLKEDAGLHAPLSVLFYERYTTVDQVNKFIVEHQDTLQAVVGHGFIPFGKAQQPEISDFADDVDTMRWLNSLS